MKGNDFIQILLRSPLHGLMGNTMLITVRGRKTGLPITTPVNYFRDGNCLWIMSKRNRTWWRNILPGSEVKLRLKGREALGRADLILEQDAVTAQIGEYVKQLPASTRALGVRVVNGVPSAEDARRAAKDHLFVKIRIQ